MNYLKTAPASSTLQHPHNRCNMNAITAKRPRIGITMDVGAADENRKTLELPADYADSIFRAGGMPVLLPFTHDAAIRQEMIESLDGLLVPGGKDLDPKLYGQAKHATTDLADRERQDFDLAMLALAEARRLPTLGICLGCQTMNVQRRGTLHQHLPELHQDAALQHRQPGDRSNTHDVVIRTGTHLADAMKLEKVPANSRHHQGIDRVGHGLVPTAVAPDGLVEAVEDPTLPFWVAVQWHPENLGGTPHERLFEALVAAARLFREKRVIE
ncbi:MAG TPA: gamma-glutamyl-gamma-aminobutyrate hydrolase family protein [Phycisphaerae bacterium]|jgi:putative glutamine amidotransferase